jgi:succinoglycan biosynthesis transport protein ExoP
MLQTNPRLAYPPSGATELLSPTELFFQGVAIVRRHWVICVAMPVLAMVLAVIYLIMTPPQFTATATMAIDMRKSSSMMPGSASTTETPIDNPTVESQVEILKSENISLPVIRDLKLVDDPAFMASSGLGSVIGALRSLVLPSRPYTEFERTRAAVEQFERRLGIRRKGVTFVFEISFTSPDRDQAAQIANAVAEAYVVDQLEAKYNATKRAGLWLQDRLRELGKQASDAERAVVAFKSRNNIVDTGGRLMNEQQVAELNSQLAVARANESEAQAKLTRIQDVMRQDVPDADVTDALHNEVIIKLRNQHADLSKREADLIVRTGPNHRSSMSAMTWPISANPFVRSSGASLPATRATTRSPRRALTRSKPLFPRSCRNRRPPIRRRSSSRNSTARRRATAHSTTASCNAIWNPSSSSRFR